MCAYLAQDTPMNNAIPEPITRLIDAFSRLPGVGPKTAARLTFYLLKHPAEMSITLADALRDLKTLTRLCSTCYNITVTDPCTICGNSHRDQNVICVVEEPLDVLAIERTGAYHGVYHVLHGAINYVNGVGVENLKIRELVERIDKGTVQELIIATNPSFEGEATANFIEKELIGKSLKMTRLARGLPVGGDIEYADSVTLTRALQGRREI
jgi:recombination protein RecR